MDLHVPGVGAVFGIGGDLHVPGGGAVLGSSMVPPPLYITPGAAIAEATTLLGAAFIPVLPDLVEFDALVWTTPEFDLYTETTPAWDAYATIQVEFDLER